MRNKEFKQRARAESLRYGEDSLVFLRELSQNARDAGARRILVRAEWAAGKLTVSFDDDGRGMTREHAQSFLFRLYASSKEDDASSAGRFGVGFWSVLLFEPALLRIESKPEVGRGWCLEMDGDLTAFREGQCRLRRPGTQVVLERPEPDPRGIETIRRGLARYCRHLRRADRAHAPLPVFFNGETITSPFTVPGPCRLAFEDGPVEGVVGLGESPNVELYAKGLLVWRGALLDELRYSSEPATQDYQKDGLSPVYKLNGSRLNVTLDRRSVVDDKQLARVRRTARRHTRRLLARYLDELSPRPALIRLRDALLAGLEEGRQKIGMGLAGAALVAAVMGMGVLVGGFPLDLRQSEELPKAPALASRSPLGAPTEGLPLGKAFDFRGPSVDPLGQMGRLPLAYAPPRPVELRTAAFEILDFHLGVRRARDELGSPPTPLSCAGDCLDIAAETHVVAGQSVPLPVPTGYGVVPQSLRWEGSARPSLLDFGGITHAVFSKDARGVVSYRAAPLPARTLPPARLRRLLQIPPDVTLPPLLARLADQARKEKTPLRVEKIVEFVRDRIIYDRSAATAAIFTRFFSRDLNRSWLDFVVEIGRGDCDVKNAVALTMLRRAAVPSRLAIGVIGEDGAATEGFHAWVEYHHRSLWHAADATGTGRAAASDPSPDDGGGDSASPRGPSTSARDPFVSAAPDRDFLFWSAVISLAVAVIFSALGLLAFLRRAARSALTTDERRSRTEVAAKMLAGAIAMPNAWRGAGGILTRPLLPTVDGDAISLRRASRLARKGRLWFTRRPFDPSIRGRRVVLDAADPEFEQVAPRIPGAQDLDELVRLFPQSKKREAAGAHAPVYDLVSAANTRLERLGFPPGTLAVCSCSREDCITDVDLARAGIEVPGLPRRYVAVCAGHEKVQKIAELARTNFSIATFALLDLTVERSALLSRYAEKIRRELALELIRGDR